MEVYLIIIVIVCNIAVRERVVRGPAGQYSMDQITALPAILEPVLICEGEMFMLIKRFSR